MINLNDLEIGAEVFYFSNMTKSFRTYIYKGHKSFLCKENDMLSILPLENVYYSKIHMQIENYQKSLNHYKSIIQEKKDEIKTYENAINKILNSASYKELHEKYPEEFV